MPESAINRRLRLGSSPTQPLPPPITHPRPSSTTSMYRIFFRRPWTWFTILKLTLAALVLLLLVGFNLYETHIEFSFYDRAWVHSTIDPIPPLGGCFAEGRVSPTYNLTARVWGPKRASVMSGLDMRLGRDCYNFAGTLKSAPHADPGRVLSEEERTQFHTYWRVDLVKFGPRQAYALQSFFATQHLAASHLTLWSNGEELSADPIVRSYLARFPHSFAVRKLDMHALAQQAGSEAASLWNPDTVQDSKAWVDGDLIRLLLLWNYGGVWVDMDSLLTRDLSPLLDHEFVTQWDCYDKVYKPFNGALMHFHQHSPYICEAFHVMSHSPSPRPNSNDWGATLYLQLWRRLVQAGIPPFSVLPFCFSDGRSCRLDNRLPDPFAPDRRDGKWTGGLGVEEGGGLDQVLGKIFSVHLHNQWDKQFPKGGWVDRLLLQRYEAEMG